MKILFLAVVFLMGMFVGSTLAYYDAYGLKVSQPPNSYLANVTKCLENMTQRCGVDPGPSEPEQNCTQSWTRYAWPCCEDSDSPTQCEPPWYN
jgi:hypothetical protein